MQPTVYLFLAIFSVVAAAMLDPGTEPAPASPPNVVFILSDDHRYDFMGFTGKVPGLETPHMDRMARGGIHVKNAFVGTALCSPSRASILTGQYSHVHEVVDNDAPAREDLIYFPQYLQEAGYETAFMGKWHMGHHNADARPGFDRWISFEGQGVYYNPTLNVDGEEVSYRDSAYVTDVLTDYAVDFIRRERSDEKPFFLYLSHKAVHAEFQPAQRHAGEYRDVDIQYPPTMYPPDVDPTDYRTVTAPRPTLREKRRALEVGYRYDLVPNWVKAQRNSWHGVDYMYNGDMDFNTFYRNYLETLLGIDESIGTVLRTLEETGQLENTIVIYMGDNGFSFGEHGLIDKRQAYEESMRVPLLVYAPAMLDARGMEEIATNADIGPTILDMAGLATPEQMNGRSFLPLLRGETVADWRKNFFYEYYWERPFPQTPTVHAIRSDSFKFIRTQGIWDINEFYDLVNDPHEARNLIEDPNHQAKIAEMNRALFEWLEETQGLKIPLKPTLGVRGGQDWKYGHTY
ncbi:sulfatase [Lewinella sp. JB7]|uniref:sulfatase family protein n=1 Tax=Lewinella sp. JB7 TaxID=2962887 RepID=UPI0020C93EE7|nr:sulfatase [Lewinella sp. JB7]MCP9236996.1 sulfatase [Lewinella sp. JB7]